MNQPCSCRRVHLAALATLALLLACGCGRSGSEQPKASTVQIDLGAALTSRLVITVHDGVVQLPSPDQLTRPHPAVMITEAAALNSKVTCRTLPDSGVFASNLDHPEVILPYGVAAAGMQVRMSDHRTDAYEIAVPPGRYERLQLFLLSNNGRTPITVSLHYGDGSTIQRSTTVMDWYNPPGASDPGWVVLAGNLGKVTAVATLAEHDHHYINGFDLAPDPSRQLTSFAVVKNDSRSELFLFGATAVRVLADQ